MWTIAALYRFTGLSDLPALQARVKEACDVHSICGTILLAPEGVNGTVAGEDESLNAFLGTLDELFGVRQGELKFSTASEKPFRRMKVRLKKEIITMKTPDADPARQTGEYVMPEDWNALVSEPDVFVIDTRNTYETAVGMFKGAIDPGLETFTDFKDYVDKNLDPATHKKVAMYCTGGIRCEKASSYMLSQGFETVYNLKGGILKYLECIPADQSLWDGECFVFDRRVGVGHGLVESPLEACYGCRFPVTLQDRQSGDYEEGVSCPRCITSLTPERADALRMRHAQMKA